MYMYMLYFIEILCLYYVYSRRNKSNERNEYFKMNLKMEKREIKIFSGIVRKTIYFRKKMEVEIWLLLINYG